LLDKIKKRHDAGEYPGDTPSPPPPDPAEAEARLESAWAAMGIPPIHYGSTWDNWIANTPEKKRAFDTVRGRAWKTNLFLTGKNGTGKSHLAACLAKDGATYHSLADIAGEVKADWGEERAIVRRYGKSRLLILDEICPRDEPTPFERDLLFEIVDARWGNMLPTMLITNQTVTEFVRIFGMGIADRLRAEAVIFDWESHRKGLCLPRGGPRGDDGGEGQ